LLEWQGQTVANRTEGKAETNHVGNQRESESSKQSRVRASREVSATINNPKVKHRTQTQENNAQK